MKTYEEYRAEVELALGPMLESLGAIPDRLLEAMRHDKKSSGGRIRVVLPLRIGHADIFDNIDPARLAETLGGRI